MCVYSFPDGVSGGLICDTLRDGIIECIVGSVESVDYGL